MPIPTKLALLGHNISHSKSPEIYRRLIGPQVEYDLLDIAERSLIPSWSQLAQRYSGINITTPWKEVFAEFAEENVKHLGAVNCLRLSANECRATNTDWTALRELLPAMIKKHNCEAKCVLLGDGVMARLTLDLCRQLSIPVEHLARSKGDDLQSLSLKNGSSSGQKQLLINACGRSYEFTNSLTGAWVFWDYNYAHLHNEEHVPSAHTTYVDGRELLELQAKHAIQFWNRTLPH